MANVTLDLFTTMTVLLQVVYARKGGRMYKNKSMEWDVWARGGGKEKKREEWTPYPRLEKAAANLCAPTFRALAKYFFFLFARK